MTEQTTTGFAEVNGTRLYYEVAGKGHALVLIHGGLVNRKLWDDQFSTLAQHFQVIRFDMRGLGDSGVIKAGMPPYSSIDDLYALLQTLGIKKTYVLGLSMGGAVAIDFTIAHPEMVDALIPVAAGLMGYEPEHRGENIWPEVDKALAAGEIARAVELTLRYFTDGPTRTPEQVNAYARERVRQMTTSNYQRADDLDAPWPQPLEPSASGRLSEITVPTLIIFGDQDAVETAQVATVLETGIKGAKKVIISDTAHHLNLEKPAQFNQLVLDFLTSLPQ